ncbi:SagB family peptide dehydrogenase [Microbacterium sp. EST19A]|uniref:SagB family peptide dehydrogenase n=1 Tax=Microbacterium sp. EST19A TaxID=2862681 RepID=UPI001CBC1394|nr:SagB family peptide dehydrogenase [Microbacterium sp. EST19A]
MNGPVHVALRGEVIAAPAEHGDASVLVGSRSAMAVPRPGTPERRAFDLLRTGPADAATLDAVAEESGALGLARWLRWSRRAIESGLIDFRRFAQDGSPQAVFVPVHADAPDLAHAPASSSGRLRLSRFASLARQGDAIVLESPIASMRVELSLGAAATVLRFADRAVASDDLQADADLAADLRAAGLLVEVHQDGLAREDRDPVQAPWEPHDLRLHVRSRGARGDRPGGATFRFADVCPAPRALRHTAGSSGVALPRPDLAALLAEDVPLARVMEERTSRRALGPLDLPRLGEFLFRTVRVRREIAAGPEPHDYPRLDRPHPAAGGISELITYLAVSACEGIDAGLYRYDSVGHRLDLVTPAGPLVARLLDDARRASGAPGVPPVLVILAADVARLSWKYEGIAYALLLKNVGVVYQSMQLVATAMGLGSCPLGGGDSEAFATAAGTDPLEEPSVGELMLGA